MAAQVAQDWIADLNDMLITYSPDYTDVSQFAADHSVICGHWVTDVVPGVIEAEIGWTAVYAHDTGAWALA